jgi:hypothetical protein
VDYEKEPEGEQEADAETPVEEVEEEVEGILKKMRLGIDDLINKQIKPVLKQVLDTEEDEELTLGGVTITITVELAKFLSLNPFVPFAVTFSWLIQRIRSADNYAIAYGG